MHQRETAPLVSAAHRGARAVCGGLESPRGVGKGGETAMRKKLKIVAKTFPVVSVVKLG